MNNITKYEYFTTHYLITKALFIGLGFKLLLNFSGAYLWLVIILGSLFGLAINHLITKVKQYYLTYFSSIILLVIGLLIIMKMVYTIYLNNSSFFVILFPLILLIVYTGTKKIDTIFRVSSIIFIIEIATLLIAALILIPNIDITNLFNDSIKENNIITASLLFAAYTTFPSFLITDFKKNYNYKAYLLSCFTLLLISILIIGVLSSNVAILFDYPEYIIYKRIYLLNFIENIESIIYMHWLYIYFPFLTLAYYNIKSSIKL